MSIADGKEMLPSLAVDVWVDDKGILVDLGVIVGDIALLGPI